MVSIEKRQEEQPASFLKRRCPQATALDDKEVFLMKIFRIFASIAISLMMLLQIGCSQSDNRENAYGEAAQQSPQATQPEQPSPGAQSPQASPGTQAPSSTPGESPAVTASPPPVSAEDPKGNEQEVEYIPICEYGCLDAENNDSKQGDSPHSSPVPVLTLEIAEQLFAQADRIHTEDNGALWGIKLHVPHIIADPITRFAVTNRPYPGDFLTKQGNVYAGTLPDNKFIGSTDVQEGTVWWSMLSWSEYLDMDGNNVSGYDPLRTMIHEGFHAIQDQHKLFGTPRGLGQNFFEYNKKANIYLRLELNALQKALGSRNVEERAAAIGDALSIREERRQKNLAMGLDDFNMQISEGTALYTDLMLCMDASSRHDYMQWYVKNMIGEYSVRGGFGYAAGALYGLLLDEIGADWKPGISYSTDMGVLLRDAAGITEIRPISELDLEIYGYSEILADEAQRNAKLKYIVESTENAFSAGPILRIGTTGDFSGDIGYVRIPGLGANAGVNYGHFTYFGVFGKITICEGALLLGREYEIPVPGIVIEENRAYGDNWKLELNEGFKIEMTSAGVYRISRT